MSGWLYLCGYVQSLAGAAAQCAEPTAATSPMGGIMNATKRLASIRNCMEGWGFPTSFVESEVSSVTWKFEVGGPFYERHVIVIALGSTVEPINHSIVILRFAR